MAETAVESQQLIDTITQNQKDLHSKIEGFEADSEKLLADSYQALTADIEKLLSEDSQTLIKEISEIKSSRDNNQDKMTTVQQDISKIKERVDFCEG